MRAAVAALVGMLLAAPACAQDVGVVDQVSLFHSFVTVRPVAGRRATLDRELFHAVASALASVAPVPAR